MKRGGREGCNDQQIEFQWGSVVSRGEKQVVDSRDGGRVVVDRLRSPGRRMTIYSVRSARVDQNDQQTAQENKKKATTKMGLDPDSDHSVGGMGLLGITQTQQLTVGMRLRLDGILQGLVWRGGEERARRVEKTTSRGHDGGNGRERRMVNRAAE
jgi:hypothetical protein